VLIMGHDPLVPLDPRRPNVARALNYALGGKDNFAIDRELHWEVMEVFPLATVLVAENREFLARAVDYVARRGIAQFIDIGTGLPASPDTHEVAIAACPDARVAYVDNDPVVITHVAALAARRGRVAAVPGDVCRPQELLASPALAEVIDLRKPFCVVMTVILDYVEPARADEIMTVIRDAMPPGSFLILSIGMNNDTPDVAQEVIRVYRAAQVHLHTHEQVAGYFAGLEVVEPGLTAARHWRPLQPPPADDGRPADLLAGVARKPARG
jgi:hypothetical protein